CAGKEESRVHGGGLRPPPRTRDSTRTFERGNWISMPRGGLRPPRGTRDSARTFTLHAGVQQAVAEDLVVLEGPASADGDAGARVVGDVGGNARFAGEQLVQVAQQRPATRQEHTLLHNVRG